MESGDVAFSESYSAGKRDYRSYYISDSDRSIIYHNLEDSWDRSRHCRKYRLDLCLLAYTWDIVLAKWPGDQSSGLGQSSELTELTTA